MPAPVVAAIVSAVATAVITTVITAVVEVVIEAVFGKENTDVRDEAGAMAQATVAARALLVNKNSNNAEIPVIYGKLRTGGTRVYMETSNNSGGTGNSESENQYFNCILVMCEGKMGNIRELYFGDELVWSGNGGGDNGYTLSSFTGDYATALGDNSTIKYYNGSTTQTRDSNVGNSVGSDWPTNADLKGIAYLSIRLKANADAYAGGLPLFTAVLEGKEISNVSTITEGQTSTPSTTTGANQNAVDCIYNYLTNTIYGKGLDHDSDGDYLAGKDIDLVSFKAARVIAESTPVNGNTHKYNGTLSTRQRIYENIQRLTSSCNGLLVYSAGKYKLVIQSKNEYDASSPEDYYQFTEENMLNNVTITKGSKKNRLNKISTGYSDSSIKYVDNIEILDDSTYLAVDNGTVLETTLDQQLVTDTSKISILNRYKLDKSRHQTAISFKATHKSLVVEAGDVVGIKQDALGWTTPKPFRVMTTEIAGDNTIEFTAVEYESSIQI